MGPVFNSDKYQSLLRSGKKVPIIKTIPIPKHLTKNNSIPMRVKLAEVIRIVRPLIHAIAILIQGKPNFKSLFFSLAVDLIVLTLQFGYAGRDKVEALELRSRKLQMCYQYLFKKPLYDLFTRPLIIEPLINRLVPVEFIRTLLL